MNTHTLSLNQQPEAGRLYEASSQLNVSTPGRVISGIAGTFLLSMVYKHTPKLTLLAGGYLLYRALAGNCPVSALLGKTSHKHTGNTNIRTSVVVARPVYEVYAYWRKLSNLPLFMSHIASVTEYDDYHSHWKINLPTQSTPVEWDAVIAEEVENEVLSWRSEPGSMLQNAGKIRFTDLGEDITRVDITLSYRPPAGLIGSNISRLLQPAFQHAVEQDIAAFKQHMEQQTPHLSRL